MMGPKQLGATDLARALIAMREVYECDALTATYTINEHQLTVSVTADQCTIATDAGRHIVAIEDIR
jgi:hypothetical protein